MLKTLKEEFIDLFEKKFSFILVKHAAELISIVEDCERVMKLSRTHNDDMIDCYARDILNGKPRPFKEQFLCDRHSEAFTIMMLTKKIVASLILMIPKHDRHESAFGKDEKQCGKYHEKLENVLEWFLENADAELCILFMNYLYSQHGIIIPKKLRPGLFKQILEKCDEYLEELREQNKKDSQGVGEAEAEAEAEDA